MKPSTKRPAKANTDDNDALARLALQMIANGESHRTLAGYDIDVTLMVTPKFRSEKGGAR